MSKRFKGWATWKQIHEKIDEMNSRPVVKKPVPKKEPIDWKTYRFVIGIDTGTKTGFAIWDRQLKCLLRVETMMIHRALVDVHDLCQFERVLENRYFVRVEDSRLRKFFKGEDMAAKQQGAGSIKRDAAIWEAALKDWNIDHEMLAPRSTKMDAELFKKATGWPGRCSNHARDAASLVYGL